MVHLFVLHEVGRSSTLGYRGFLGKVPFFPYYWAQDSLNFLVLSVIFLFCLSLPYVLGDPEMFVEANSLVSPVAIVPEWYFLPFYAVLRAIPNKGLGVVFLFLRLLSLSLLAFLKNYMRPLVLFSRVLVYWFVFVVILLGWLGQCPVEFPFGFLRGLFTFWYFLSLILLAVSYMLRRVLFTRDVVLLFRRQTLSCTFAFELRKKGPKIF